MPGLRDADKRQRELALPETKTDTAQRRRTPRKKSQLRIIRVQLKDRLGHPRWITADLLDVSHGGIGIATMAALAEGAQVQVRGNLGEGRTDFAGIASVRWCSEKTNGCFHAGLQLIDETAKETGSEERASEPEQEELDHYEVMQLSPNADAETISRVYRLLAQRYHPDTAGTGNKEMFLRLCEAHRVLIDPEQRARYDAIYNESRRRRWKIFDPGQATTGAEGERRKRSGVLQLLYAKMIGDPERASMTIFEFEELLGCPREHLQGTLWYLRGKGLVKRGDNNRFEITVAGVDEIETDPKSAYNRARKLLDSGETQ